MVFDIDLSSFVVLELSNREEYEDGISIQLEHISIRVALKEYAKMDLISNDESSAFENNNGSTKSNSNH